MDVVGETSLLITIQAQTFHWVGYGLKLHTSQGSLPAGLEECRLYIKVALSGRFSFPQNTTLISAVYWIDGKPQCKFSKPIRMEFQHCSKSNQSSELHEHRPCPVLSGDPPVHIHSHGGRRVFSTWARLLWKHSTFTLFNDWCDSGRGRRSTVLCQILLQQYYTHSTKSLLCDHKGPGSVHYSKLPNPVAANSYS